VIAFTPFAPVRRRRAATLCAAATAGIARTLAGSGRNCGRTAAEISDYVIDSVSFFTRIVI